MSLFNKHYSNDDDDIWSSSDDENEMNVKNTDNVVYKLDPNFVEYITNVKRKIYSEVILKPPSNSKNAQKIRLVAEYKNLLKKIYDIIHDIQSGEYNPDDIKQFPISVRPVVFKLVKWVDVFFNNNSHMDIIPYDFYAHCCLVVHVNIQKKELPCSTNKV